MELLKPGSLPGRPAPGEPVRSLYAHVPFCHRVCPYCSFYKHTPGAEVAGFADALLAEARRVAKRVPLALETVYFGGGTPTLLSAGVLAKLLPELRRILDFSAVEEWTMEVNPRTITRKKAAVLRDCGVTRVSLGVQAWDPPTLAVLGRDHAPDEAEEAFHILREAGFPVVNIDLMFSVPGQSLETWRATLEKSVSLRPDHISAYNLTYEEDTEFFEKLRGGEFRADEEHDAAHFAEAMDFLEAAGFVHYEISNYARPGFESKHNRRYWEGRDYLGIGPGAVSTIHGVRRKNVENTALWTRAALSGAEEIPEAEREEIDDARWLCERIALSLRTREGLDARLLSGPKAEAAAALLESEGLLLRDREQNRVKLTRAGKFVADAAAAHLWEAVAEAGG